MLLDRLNALKDKYKAWLSSHAYDRHFLWESLATFQEHWDVSALDFKSMFERSFENTLANELWEGQDYFPKRAMLQFIDRDDDLVRSMFKELYDENLDITGRTDRFMYHCQAISDDIMKSSKGYQKHYHGDYRMISTYLALKYPTMYTVYDFESWRRYMEAVGAKPIPDAHDLERFFKVMRTTFKILERDEELMAKHREVRIGRDDIWQGDSLMIAAEFYQFAGSVA